MNTTKVQSKTYTREEVKKILGKYGKAMLISFMKNFKLTDRVEDISKCENIGRFFNTQKWLDTNYPE